MKYTLLLILTIVHFLSEAQNPCLEQVPVRIVVLGSSTAAGSGPSSPDSTWVNRYTNYLQSVNPSNQVINLAVGGYNTYRIMPTGYTPPPGRPSPDPLRNITAALGYDPDAIIVNMPSNDIAAGFSVAEQLFNFDSIVNLSELNSVPIWICTTQPRNFSDSLLRQMQYDLKDSIELNFAPHTIDFWTGIALPNYTIDPQYDSGDGVHLNDAGHAILKDRVVQTSIPDSVVNSVPGVDVLVAAIDMNASVCGDSLTEMAIVLANIGELSATGNTVDLTFSNLTVPNSLTYSQSLSNLGSCQYDTLYFTVNMYNQGNYLADVAVVNGQDTMLSNNQMTSSWTTSGHPWSQPVNDTLCAPGNAILSVNCDPQDTVFWYDSFSSTTPIASGNQWTTPFISASTTFFAEVVRGNLFYSGNLFTTLSSTINFNGAMFDIIAMDSIEVDSLAVKINSLGSQGVNVYISQNSFQISQNNSALWTLLGTYNVNVQTNTDYTSVPAGFSMEPGDTFGIYVHLANAASNLSYRSIPNLLSRSNNEIELVTGYGVAYNFGNLYTYRDLNAGVFYHYGDRPDGDCKSERLAIDALVSSPFTVMSDTIIDILDTLVVVAPNGLTNIQWYNGSTNDTLVILASDLGVGVHHLDLTATDSLNCTNTVSFIVAVADLVGLNSLAIDKIKVFPNPTSGVVYSNVQEGTEYRIVDLEGRTIQEGWYTPGGISMENCLSGIYFLSFSNTTRSIRIQKNELSSKLI